MGSLHSLKMDFDSDAMESVPDLETDDGFSVDAEPTKEDIDKARRAEMSRGPDVRHIVAAYEGACEEFRASILRARGHLNGNQRYKELAVKTAKRAADHFITVLHRSVYGEMETLLGRRWHRTGFFMIVVTPETVKDLKKFIHLEGGWREEHDQILGKVTGTMDSVAGELGLVRKVNPKTFWPFFIDMDLSRRGNE